MNQDTVMLIVQMTSNTARAGQTNEGNVTMKGGAQ